MFDKDTDIEIGLAIISRIRPAVREGNRIGDAIFDFIRCEIALADETHANREYGLQRNRADLADVDGGLLHIKAVAPRVELCEHVARVEDTLPMGEVEINIIDGSQIE